MKKDGRGYTVWEKKRVLVPRLVLYLVEGEWPDHACHTCHRPPCLNPNHLYNGTAESNARDRVESGRHVNSRQRLSDDDVDAIRAARLAGESIVSLGLKYGVNSGTISRAARGISVQARGLVAPVPAWMKAMPVYPDRRGSRNQAAKVTGEMVRKVRHLAATGERQVRIAADVGISQSAVSAIVNRKTWAHVA